MSLKKTKSNSNSKKLKVPKKPSSTTKTTTAAASTSKAPPTVRKTDSDESDSSDILSDDENNKWKETKRIVSDPTPEYQNIQKLIRYVKAGNTTATIVSLCCLKDYDLSIPMNQIVSLPFRLFMLWFVNKYKCHLIELLMRVCINIYILCDITNKWGNNNNIGTRTYKQSKYANLHLVVCKL